MQKVPIPERRHYLPNSQQKKGYQNERTSHRKVYDKKQTRQVAAQKTKGVQQTHEYSPKCYNCGKASHLAKNCKAQKSESSGQSDRKNSDSNIKNSRSWYTLYSSSASCAGMAVAAAGEVAKDEKHLAAMEKV